MTQTVQTQTLPRIHNCLSLFLPSMKDIKYSLPQLHNTLLLLFFLKIQLGCQILQIHSQNEQGFVLDCPAHFTFLQNRGGLLSQTKQNQKQVLLYSPGLPGIHYVDLADLSETHLPLSQLMELQACTTMHDPSSHNCLNLLSLQYYGTSKDNVPESLYCNH